METGANETTPTTDATDKDVLIVVSKLKNYIRAQSGMSTSASVANVLSDYIRRTCNDAIENAKADGRKTVMDRDFRFPPLS